jgi:hypothetical protein
VIQASKTGELRIMRYKLTDHGWAAIRPMLPSKPRGAPRVNDRRVLNGIFVVLHRLPTWRSWLSDHGDKFALGVAIAINVSLGGLDRPVASQQLNVPQRATDLVDQPSSAGDERSAARMGGAAFQSKLAVRGRKPNHDTKRLHRTATLRPNHRASANRHKPPDSEGIPQLRMHGDLPSASIFRGMIPQFDGATYAAIRIEDHVPGQFCNLAGSEPGLGGQQHNDLVSGWMPGAFGVDKEIFYIVFGYRFRLLAGHILHRDQIVQLIIARPDDHTSG